MRARITRKPGNPGWVAFRAGIVGWVDKWGPFGGPFGVGLTPAGAYADLVCEIEKAKRKRGKTEVVYFPPKDAP